MATIKEVFALVVQADVQGGTAAIRSFAAGAKKDLKDVEASSGQMYASLQRGGAQLAAAGAAGLAALAAMGSSARKAASDVIALQRVSGGSAEEVSKLRFAAQQTGVDLGQLSTGLVRLSRNASTDKGAETLARYGVAARDASGQVRPLGDLLSDVAGAVAALPAGAQKNDLVVSIFGRGGASLLPLLNRGADGLDQLGVKAAEFGAVLDGKALAAAKRYTAAQRDMNAAVDGLKTSIGKDVLPTLASVNEAVAGLASGAARGFESLPDSFRQTAVSGGLAVSAVASVTGTVASSIGTYGLAANGIAAMTTKFGGLGAAAAALGGPLALAVVGIGGVVAAVAQLNDQEREGIEIQAVNVSRIAQAGKLRQEAARKAAADDVAAQLARKQQVGPIDALDRIGPYGKAQEDHNRAALAAAALRNVKTAIEAMPRDQAVRALDEIGAAMQRAGTSSERTRVTLAPLYAQFGATGPVDDGAAAVERYTKAVEAAAAKGVTLRQALDGLKDGVNVGELTVYADALGSSLDPVYGLIDANKRLADAQTKVATSAKRDTSGIESAYRALAAAKQRLDDVLRGDGEDRRQVSPEVQIADARRRILEANARIARSPQDAGALSARDEALADLDRATNRRQQLNREAAQKEREVRDARQAVADAERDLSDARKKADEDYVKAQQSAADDVLRAAVDQKRAALTFADAILTGKLKVDDVSAQLQQLVDQGILPQSVKDEFVGKMLTLTQQAGLAAAALQQLAQGFQPGGPPTGAPGAPGSNVYGPPAPAKVVPVRQPPSPTGNTVTRPAGAQNTPVLGPAAPAAIKAYVSSQVAALPVKGFTVRETLDGRQALVMRLLNQGLGDALIQLMRQREGRFPGFAYGGIVGGSGGIDSQVIRATPGEGVVNPNGMRLLGARGLAAINTGSVSSISGPTYHDSVTNNITLVSPDVERGASLVQRRIEQSRRARARRRLGAR